MAKVRDLIGVKMPFAQAVVLGDAPDGHGGGSITELCGVGMPEALATVLAGKPPPTPPTRDLMALGMPAAQARVFGVGGGGLQAAPSGPPLRPPPRAAEAPAAAEAAPAEAAPATEPAAAAPASSGRGATTRARRGARE